MFRRMRSKVGLGHGLALLMLLVTVGCGGRNRNNQPPVQNQVPIQRQNPFGGGGGFGGGFGGCGSIGQTVRPVNEQPINLQVGNGQNTISNLRLFYTRQFIVGQEWYEIVGSGQFNFPDLRLSPQYAQTPQITFAVCSSQPIGNTPTPGTLFANGELAITLRGTVQSTIGFNPNGSPQAGGVLVSVDLQGVFINGGISGDAIVTIDNGFYQPEAYRYDVFSSSFGGGFGGGGNFVPTGGGFGGFPGAGGGNYYYDNYYDDYYDF